MSRDPAVVVMVMTVLAASFAGCMSAPRSVSVTEADTGRTVEVALGGTLNVTLASNPSTGYAWNVTAVDQGILQLEGPASYRSHPGSEGQVGAGGQESFLFKAVGEGQTVLKMEYIRGFEPDSPAETFEITVSVESRSM